MCILPTLTLSWLGPHLSPPSPPPHTQWVPNMLCSKDSVVYLISHTKPQTFLDPDFPPASKLLLVSALLHGYSTSPSSCRARPWPQDEAERESECCCRWAGPWPWASPLFPGTPGTSQETGQVPSGWPGCCVCCCLPTSPRVPLSEEFAPVPRGISVHLQIGK